MHVVRCHDTNGVDVLLFLPEHLPPVLIDPDIREELLHPRRARQICIRYRNEGEGGMARERTNVGQRLPGGADTRMPDFSVLRQQASARERGDNRRAGDPL
jgi:hypothetical protein